eukprot:3498987-Lingulodinium_polyedra.AAC.1
MMGFRRQSLSGASATGTQQPWQQEHGKGCHMAGHANAAEPGRQPMAKKGLPCTPPGIFSMLINLCRGKAKHSPSQRSG